jgi:hypothetical protein
VSPLRLRRSSITVKLLFNVNHSRPWFLVSCGCRILPGNAHQQTSTPPVGSSTRDFERWLNGGLEVKRLSLSLYGSSVKGTWSEGSVTGDSGG